MAWLLEGLAPLQLSAAGFFELMRSWIALRRALRRFVAGYAAVLYPAAAGPAPLHGRRPSDDGELTDYGNYGYSFAYAVGGVPVVAVPAGSERGLPVGIQVVPPAYRDHVALAVAAVVEREQAPAVPVPHLPATLAQQGS
jgi:amidase